jgi:hypothetical protein
MNRFTLTAIMLQMIQGIGAMSGSIQKFIIHSLQPITVGLLFLLFQTLQGHPIILIAISIMFLIGIIILIRQYVLEEREEKSHIHPAVSDEEGGAISNSTHNQPAFIQSDLKIMTLTKVTDPKQSSESPLPIAAPSPVEEKNDSSSDYDTRVFPFIPTRFEDERESESESDAPVLECMKVDEWEPDSVGVAESHQGRQWNSDSNSSSEISIDSNHDSSS